MDTNSPPSFVSFYRHLQHQNSTEIFVIGYGAKKWLVEISQKSTRTRRKNDKIIDPQRYELLKCAQVSRTFIKRQVIDDSFLSYTWILRRYGKYIHAITNRTSLSRLHSLHSISYLSIYIIINMLWCFMVCDLPFKDHHCFRADTFSSNIFCPEMLFSQEGLEATVTSKSMRQSFIIILKRSSSRYNAL